jgi:hypothetical protein
MPQDTPKHTAKSPEVDKALALNALARSANRSSAGGMDDVTPDDRTLAKDCFAASNAGSNLQWIEPLEQHHVTVVDQEITWFCSSGILT